MSATVEVIRAGDRAFFEPDENHWHGAAPNRFMAHVAMQQNDDSGSPVTWGTHVSMSSTPTLRPAGTEAPATAPHSRT